MNVGLYEIRLHVRDTQMHPLSNCSQSRQHRNTADRLFNGYADVKKIRGTKGSGQLSFLPVKAEANRCEKNVMIMNTVTAYHRT